MSKERYKWRDQEKERRDRRRETKGEKVLESEIERRETTQNATSYQLLPKRWRKKRKK